MLRLEKQTCAAVRQVGQNSGEVRIGTMETFAAVHLAEALKRLCAEHPGLELKVYTNTSARLIEQVAAHKLDCAFVGGEVEHPDLHAKQLLQEELVMVSSLASTGNSQPLILLRGLCLSRSSAGLATSARTAHQRGYGVGNSGRYSWLCRRGPRRDTGAKKGG